MELKQTYPEDETDPPLHDYTTPRPQDKSVTSTKLYELKNKQK